MVEFTGEVHPVADLFPKLPKDELEDLAASIKEEGLLQPIVLDAEGRLLDGRNRLAACKLAKVDPTFEVYEGDPDAYALTVNIARRHLTKGQRAMIAARSRVFVSKTVVAAADAADVSQARIGYADTVIKWAPDMVDAVVSGATSLDAAYAKARANKQAYTETEQTMQQLLDEAPDLASQVVEETLTLGEAAAANDQRRREKRERIERHATRLREVIAAVDQFFVICGLDEFDLYRAALNDGEMAQIDNLKEKLK